MANEEHLVILKKGVDLWNEWRKTRAETRPDLSKADLHDSNLSGANFWHTNLSGANLRGCDLSKAKFFDADLTGTNLREAVSEEVKLSGANLSGAVLFRANLRRADLRGSTAVDADVREAILANGNLTDADFRGADMTGADLRHAILIATNFAGATMRGTNLIEADLTGAILRDAILSRSRLERANLHGADLHNAVISGVQMDGTNLAGSGMERTVISNVDLTNVKGLDSVLHLAPSTLGIDTVSLSKGNIPQAFLRGVGVPDEFITYMKSLVTNPIEFYSCFISYSTKDEEFARRLYADLQSRNVRCWFAPHDVHGGKKLHEQIDEAIRMHEKLLLILSDSSMASEWVKTEIAKARKREMREKKQVLFPVRLVTFEAIRDWECFDADTGKDSAREIREYFISDFSEWKEHDKYKEAFNRLIEDLKTAATAK